MILLDRRRSRPDPLLEWKTWLFGAGAFLALAGIALESSILTGAAILVLLGGVGLRFWRPSDPGARSELDEGAEGKPGDRPA